MVCYSSKSSTLRARTRRLILRISISALLAASATAQLQWDPTGGAAGAQGGSGDWLTSNDGKPWWNGTTNVAWTNGLDAIFSGGAGSVAANGIVVDDIDFGNFPTLTGSLELGMGEGEHQITTNAITTISASISGTEGFVKLGAGTLTLSGSNTFQGQVSINQGTLVLGGDSAVGSANRISVAAGSSLVVNRGFPKPIGSLTGAGSVSVADHTLFIVGADDSSTAFSGSIVGSQGFLQKIGTGTLTLSGVLSYGGSTTIDGGTLRLSGVNTYGATFIKSGTLEASGGNAIPDQSDVSIGSTGTLQLTANETIKTLTGAGAVALGSSTLTIGSGGSFSGIISGPGSLVKTGALIQALTGINTFTGGLVVANGSVAVPDLGSAGTNGPLGPGSVTLDSGGIQYSGTGTTSTDRPIAITAGGASFSGGAGTMKLGSLLSGPGRIRVDGGIVELTNPGNSFTGGILIAGQGTLALSEVPDNVATSTIGGIGPITIQGGRLRLTGTGNDSTDRPLVGGGTIDVGTGSRLTFSSPASGSGNFRKEGGGTLVFTGTSNTSTGGVVIAGGTLEAGPLVDAAVPSGLGAGNSIFFDGPGQLTLPAGVNGTTNRSLSGIQGRINISNSTITLNGNINGNFAFAGSNPSTDIFVLSPTSYPSSNYPFIGIKGKITLDGVKVRVTGGAGLPSEGRVELVENTGSVLDILIPTTIGTLQGGGGSNPGRVNLAADLVIAAKEDATFAGVIEGTGGIALTGSFLSSPGILLFTGANTFSGGVVVSSGGRLAITDVANRGISSSLGSGESVQLQGGTLIFNGAGTDSTNRALLMTGATIEVTNQDGTLIWSGPINPVDTGAQTTLTKNGPGTLRLTGANGYQGDTRVTAGKLQVLGSTALSNSGRVFVFPGAILELLTGTNETIGSLEGDGTLMLGSQRLVTGGNGLTTTFSGLISGASTSQLEKQGGGVFALTNPNSAFNGGLTIAEGSVVTPFVANAGMNSPIGSNGAITLGDTTNTGRFVINNTGTNTTNRPILVSAGGGIIETSNANAEVAVSGAISGGGALVKLGAGRLTLTGDKMFSGSLVVADGNLRLDGSIANVPVTVLDPGSLDSSGPAPKSMGALTVAGGTVSPGLPGETDVFNTGNLTLSSGRLAINLNSLAASGYDSLNVSGGVSFDRLIELTIELGYDPEDFVGAFPIIVNDGSDLTVLNGPNARFSYKGHVLEDGSQFLVESNSFSQIFEMRYGLTAEDNDVRLVVIPEPSAAVLASLGILAVGLRRNRRSGSCS